MSAALAQEEQAQPRGLTLYAMNNDLAELISERLEMVQNAEDTVAIDYQISLYLRALPDKVDAVAAVLRTLGSQAQLATEEVARLNARRRAIESAKDRLERYAMAVLEQQPQPKRGSKRLEGRTATLSLCRNGSVQPLEIADESLVPDEYCTAEITMHYSDWRAVCDLVLQCGAPAVQAAISTANCEREPENKAVRAALEQPCFSCDGNGGECSSCGGSGKAGVPGARLLERGFHLGIR